MYKVIVESDMSYPREYEQKSRSAMKAAEEFGRCEGGEIVSVFTKKQNIIISQVRYSPEDGGKYYRCKVR